MVQRDSYPTAWNPRAIIMCLCVCSDNRVFGKQPLQDGFVAEVATAPSVLHVVPEVSTLFLH